jgi:hypothetical protein
MTTAKTYNAEKWTEEKMNQLLDNLLCHLNQNEDNLYIGKMLSYFGLYPDIWAYLKRSFAHDEFISKRIKKIEYIFEARIVEAALHKRISPSMAMFVLRCKYGWKDKTIETAKPKETSKPLEEAPKTGPGAPEASADAGSTSTEAMDDELNTIIRLLPQIDEIEDEYNRFSPLKTKVEELAATG